MSGKLMTVFPAIALLLAGCGDSDSGTNPATDDAAPRAMASSDAAPRAMASSVPVSGQHQVNDFAAGAQRTPDIAHLPGGGYVGVWGSEFSCCASPDGDLDSLSARVLDASAAPAAPEFVLNADSVTEGDQIQPAVAATDDGFIAVWWSQRNSGSAGAEVAAVFGQRFSADGTAAGAPFQVDDPANIGVVPANPDIAVAPDGTFVVAWVSFVRGLVEHSVFLRRFEADGTPIGEPERVGGLGILPQMQPRVVMGPDGAFAIAWNTFREYRTIGGPPPPDIPLPLPDAESRFFGTVSDIRLRCFEPDGSRATLLARYVDAALRLQADGGEYVRRPALARVGDRVVVSWSRVEVIEDRERFAPSVLARVYGFDCRAEGDAATITDNGTLADITGLAGGGFVAAWAEPEPETPDRNIVARRFDDVDTPAGPSFRVNDVAPAPGDEDPVYRPRVAAADAPGVFAVIWEGSAPGDARGIYARAFAPAQ